MSKQTTSKRPKKTRTASKTTSAYWAGKIRLEKKPGWESSNYFVRIQADGMRRKMKLKSSFKEEAAREAAEIYIDVLSNGWPQDDGARIPLPGTPLLPENPTIEDWSKAVTAKNLAAAQSVKKYTEALQTIVGEILGTPRARKPESRNRIRNYPVALLTKKTLSEWLEKRVATIPTHDPVAASRANNTTRSLIINARSLFGEKVLNALKIEPHEMPYIPFHGIKPPSKKEHRYTSRFDAKHLLATACDELGGAEDEAGFEIWKIIYLALVAGLRYKEIDRLRIQEILLAKCRISVRPHYMFAPKNQASIGDVPITKSAAEVLERMIRKTPGPWFIKEGKTTKSNNYRSGVFHDAAVVWLRNYEERGVRPLAEVPKPLHELRKEAGTWVNDSHGLVATKEFLRHSSIATTAAIYVTTKGSVTTGLA